LKKGTIIFVFLLALSRVAFNQSATDSSQLVTLNQQIDTYVIQKNMAALDTLYADDFVFSHGTGLVEGKAGWLKTVTNGTYLLRQHDSVKVELHPGIAIVKGKMDNRRVNAGDKKTVSYHLRYIRMYALRNGSWKMISHNTTFELDDP
jgi:Domain of unknown function (DUF4440)